MPGHAPNKRFVTAFYHSKGLFFTNIPENYRAFAPACGNKSFMNWMPRKRKGFFFVTPQNLIFLFQISDIKYLDQMISCGASEPMTIFIPLYIHYCSFMCI